MSSPKRPDQPPKGKLRPPVAVAKGASATPNPKLVDQTRKRLGKHYASKYQTMRRG